MDDRRFDQLTRSLAAGASRRRVLKGILGGILGGAALGGASKTYAEDDETPVVETDTGTDQVVDETVTGDDTPAEAPPTEVPPTEVPPTEVPPTEVPPTEVPPTEVPPTEVPPAEVPPAEPALVQAGEDTPIEPAGPVVIVCDIFNGQAPCDSICCDRGWRCCGVYCIQDREDSCCGQSECGECQTCGQDGICHWVCEELGLDCCVDQKTGFFTCAECCRNDPNCQVVVDCDFCHENDWECCVDDKHHVTCAQCCDDSDCASWGPCHTCYGGYCLSCFDQTDGNAPLCAISDCGNQVIAGEGSHDYCVECCEDWQCGPCEYCHNGWCEYGCEDGKQCCQSSGDDDDDDDFNGGYCAHCCGNEDCGDCEVCGQGWCHYECDKDEVCCHGEYCAYEHEGCCGVSGDWCDPVTGSDHLNGSCCGDLHCCWDDKKGGTCSECCGDYDCQSGYCCGGVCQAECCDDKDCRWGVCVEGYCNECRDNDGCHKGEICCDGTCYGDRGCCGSYVDDPVNCGECETCIDYWCTPTGVELYGSCNPMYLAPADATSPQLNCCNGLVCCESHKYGLVCLECCGDQDCAAGCYCDDGFCSCPCWSNKDCADGTCCCKNGSCSADCCPEPPKPTPKPPAGGTITTLPATGSGDTAKGSGWLGAAALGAAAAYLAGRKLKADAMPEAQAPEE